MISAEKTNKNVSVARQHATGTTFFRKAGEEAFFNTKENNTFFGATIQPKLTISKPDDPLEKEADAVAETVMRVPEPVAVTEKEDDKLQRKEEDELEVQPKLEIPGITAIQRKGENIQCKVFSSVQPASNNIDSAIIDSSSEDNYSLQPKHISLHHSDVVQCSGRGPPQSFIPIEDTLQSSKGAGSPLPDTTRSYMESRFNADFNGVRIHNDSTAQSLSTGIHAQAFTHGNDIYFNSGKYAPHTANGRTLLAHELTHTIQQGASSNHSAPSNTVSPKSIQRATIPPLDKTVTNAKAEEGKVSAKVEVPNCSRKHEAAEHKDENGSIDETEVQTKPELSSSHVNAKGELHQQSAIDVAEEQLQGKEEQLTEDPGKHIRASLQMKTANEFDYPGYSTANNSTSANHISSPNLNKHSSFNTSSSVQTKEEQVASARGPPVQLKVAEGTIQCGWFDSALSFVNDAIDYVAEGLEAGKRLILNEARDFVMAIPGYRALRVVLGRDPITGEVITQDGHAFIEAAFDIMPGGRLLHEKLSELGALDEAAGWIDNRIAGVHEIVNNVTTRVENFWSGLSLASLADPTQIFQDAGNIIHSTISDIVNFAIDAGRELLEIVKRFLLTELAEFVQSHTTAYPLLTVILGQDPITEQAVDKNGTNILNALLELGGETGQEQRRQMLETGTFQRIAAWIDEGIAVFGNAYEQIKAAINSIWEFVTIDSLMHPIETFNRIYEQFAAPIERVWNFVRDTAIKIIEFIKEVLMRRLSAWARTVRGYSLVTVIIGEDPFTHEEVPRSIENIIRGFMSLMEGGEEQYNQLVESGAIGRTAQRIRAAVARLNMTPAVIIQLFIDLWNSFSLNDLSDPIAAFRRILELFGEPIARLIDFVVEIVRIVVETIMQLMNFPGDLIVNIINRAMAAFERIKRDPVGFLKNLLRAIKQGFIQFFDNIIQHLLNGLTGWLLSELRDAGVTAPTDFSMQGIIAWVLGILGITMERIWEKLAAHPRVGPQRVARIRSMINTLEGIWTFIKDVQERGIAAIWDKIQEQLTNLWETVLETIKSWVMDRVINEMTARLLSMLDPTGIMAVINSAIALYRAIQSFIQYLRQMLEVVNSFVEGVADIAAGNVATAANFLEGAMDRAMPVVIGFLANQVGLRNIGGQIAGIIGRVRAMVDRALDWLIDRAVNVGGRLLEMGRSAAGAVLGWLGLRKEFRTQTGETHSLYFEGGNETAELTMASEPRRYKRYLDTLAASPTVTSQQRQNIAQAQVKLDLLNVEKRANRNNQGPDSTVITQLMNDIANLTKDLIIDNLPLSTPPIYGGLQHGFGKQVTVQKLTKNGPMGTTPSATNDNWNLLRRRLSTQGGRTFYVRGHMLNHNIHGSGSEWRNLTPLTQQANTQFEARIESQVKRMVNVENKMLYFEVIADYTRPLNSNKDSIVNAEPDLLKKARLQSLIEAEVAVPHEVILVVDEYQKSPAGEWTDTKVNVITDHIYNQNVDGTTRSDYNIP